jgi:lantibiotic transport system permease protein
MLSILKSEFLKLKRKHFVLVIGLMHLLEIAWVFTLTAKAKQEFLTWENLILNFGVLNGLFFPIIIAVIVSRLIDLEHKENTWRLLLATPIHKASVYFSKLIISFVLLLIPAGISFLSTIIIGNILDFPGSFPFILTIKFVLASIVSSICIVALQLWISLIIKNQAFALAAGIIGSFLGYFGQMFSVSRLFIWTYPAISNPITFKMIDGHMNYQYNPSYLSNIYLSLIIGIFLILLSLNHFIRKDIN